jgi:hypothetical protein
MNIDEILSTSVDELARGVHPPRSDPGRVRARARSTRRRQWAATAAAAGVVTVAGVAITSGLLDRGSTASVANPTPSPPSVVQANESAIWSDSKSLHFGSHEATAAPERIFGFGLVDGGVVYSTDIRDAKLFFQPTDGGAATQIGDSAQAAPAGDPTSGLAAWFEADGNEGSLVVYDTKTDREVARARTAVPPALRPQDGIVLVGFSPVISVSSAAVYYHGPGDEIWVYRWRAGDAPESTGMTKHELFDVAGGVTAQAGSKKGSVEFVSAEGNALATGLPSGGYLSPDGELFASVDGNERGLSRILVSDTSTGETTKLDLFGSGGERGFLFGVGWSSNDTLMVQNIPADESAGARQPNQMIACTVSTGACDVVAAVDDSFFATVPVS